ncbi:DUF1361 domain-containing protein [Paenibacillus barcinonensis]|uniref:DUF1361 domain-containing protein n=1 Tax=Paenibacillus barcinonensis TaxID=198119 RepID=A0A2V4VCC3_PAEBA|nr:DUF1361 domain-containing protein [Paenibacillus barcinonensis]PYE51222.1 putative membrane protein [Paenibacillus barcinonensis]QKS55635.1 DUF1361 domain-containing protein [Paenibacillus barcinonensis]
MKKLNGLHMFIFLSAVTVVTVALYYVAADWLNQRYFRFLIWNLFLGWLPFIFSSITYALSQLKWKLAIWLAIPSGMLWLLFFPNSSYIVTDLLHLSSRSSRYFSGNGVSFNYWYDLSVVLMFVWTGLLIGFFSMYQLQGVIYQRLGRMASWVFVWGATALASYGVLLGRVYRLNSWDALTNRETLLQLMHESVNRSSLAFCMFFATFLITIYLSLYYLIHARASGQRYERTN